MGVMSIFFLVLLNGLRSFIHHAHNISEIDHLNQGSILEKVEKRERYNRKLWIG